MAIVIEQKKKGINLFGIIVFLFFFFVITVGGYYLFFAETPGIEVVAPSVLKSTGEISQVEFNPSKVISHPTLKNLRQFGGLPTVGNLGRQNPFISF